ncbi:MAG TPA: UbiH/UbiF/VisC/COQ6 family ubiquinone biosynthesis hydroxylase [Candidatus Sulfotelmatobacter sp.]|nr:UbiH/UbiF/VisC/COQ6 family ubiquinone biosynthesis hydroxylase [Candidatus Sulfotelmatobacter sp.]
MPPGSNPGHAFDADVIIAGGGLVGLSLAIALGRGGLEVVAVDREDPARVVGAAFDGRVSAIAHASQQALAAIGIWRHVREAEPILDIRVSDGASRLFLHYDHRDLDEQPFGHIVENRVIRQAQQAALGECAHVRLMAPVAVAGLAREPGRAVLSLAGGQRLSAPLVLAADGRHSPLRQAAGIPCLAWRYPQTGIVCTVRHDLPHQGVAQERFLPAGPFAILPMTGNRSSLVWTEREVLAPAILALDDAAFAAELAERFGDYLGALRVEGPRWSYPLALHHAASYVAPRLALVGDAAHGIHPIAGQGLNMGLRDVAALGEVLVEAHRLGLDLGDLAVLERYERWRRFDNLLLAGMTDGLNRLFSTDSEPVRLARDLGLAAVNRLPPLKRLFMRHARGSVGKLPRLLEGRPL